MRVCEGTEGWGVGGGSLGALVRDAGECVMRVRVRETGLRVR